LRERCFDFAATARCGDAGAHPFVLDDEKSRYLVHGKPLYELRPIADVDVVETERAVVAASLQHLRQETFGSASAARTAIRKEKEDRTHRPRAFGSLHPTTAFAATLS